jgi:hypothetical protein
VEAAVGPSVCFRLVAVDCGTARAALAARARAARTALQAWLQALWRADNEAAIDRRACPPRTACVTCMQCNRLVHMFSIPAFPEATDTAAFCVLLGPCDYDVIMTSSAGLRPSPCG